MHKRSNVVRVFLTNGTAVDIEVPDDYDCGLAGARALKGEAIMGRDYYIAGNLVTAVIRLFTAGIPETVN